MTKTLAILLAAVALGASPMAQATAISTSHLGFADFAITPGSGALKLMGDWWLQSYAEARNSKGDLAQAFADNFFGGMEVEQGNAQASYSAELFSVAADAVVPWAQARAEATDESSPPPGLDIAAPVQTNVLVPGCQPKWATGVARSDLFNGFMVTGGTGTVEVTFSVDLGGQKTVATDPCGLLAWAELTFTLEIYDLLPVLEDQSLQDQVVLFHKNRLECDGPNCFKEEIVDKMLTATRVVEYGKLYSFVVETDDEQYAMVPVPPTLLLALLGLAVLPRAGRVAGAWRRTL